jgi:hypothetical protein
MTSVTKPRRDLFLITGIPGTGKTTYGNELARQFGFAHHDLEEQNTLNRLAANPMQFINDITKASGNAVVTWGFLPEQSQVSIVLQFKSGSFKLIWFDGNRPAALKVFQQRRTVSEELFYLQMYRIEASKVVEAIKPVIIDPFDAQRNFKSTAMLLDEMRQQ